MAEDHNIFAPAATADLGTEEAAWNRVRQEARALSEGRGINQLLTAVDEYGAACATRAGAPVFCGSWAWVPLEPCTAMLIAGNHGQPGDFSALKVWQDMLAVLQHSFDYTRPVDPPHPLPRQARAPATDRQPSFFDWRVAVRVQGLLAESAAKQSPAGEAAILRDVATWAARLLEMEATATSEMPAEKYDDTLLPFLELMRKELHANAGKGDRPGWLKLSAEQALLEIYWHTAKLSAAVKHNNGDAIIEHCADVANMAMMLLDVCGGLGFPAASTVSQAGEAPLA